MSTKHKRPARTREQARRVRVERDTASRLMALGYLFTSLETLRWCRTAPPIDCTRVAAIAAKRYATAAKILRNLTRTLEREYGAAS
jgi:hypothetical protein